MSKDASTLNDHAQLKIGRLSYWRALGSGLFTTFLFSWAFPLSKLALVDARPLTLTGLRFFGGFLVIMLCVPILTHSRFLAHGERIRIRLDIKLLLPLLGIGILLYSINFGLLFLGLEHLAPTTASLLANQSPLFVLLIGWIVLSEQPSPLQLMGIVIAMLGVYLFFGGVAVTGQLLWIGVVLASSFAYAGARVASRALLQHSGINSLTLTAWSLGFGGILSLGMSWLLEGLPQINIKFIIIVACLATLCTALAYSLWNYALSRLPAFQCDILLAIVPLETALISWVFFGQAIRAYQLLGMGVVLVGVMLVQLAYGSQQRSYYAERK